MPAVTKTPNDKWMLCQNLDNQITTYSASDRFKLNRKKARTSKISLALIGRTLCSAGPNSVSPLIDATFTPPVDIQGARGGWLRM